MCALLYLFIYLFLAVLDLCCYADLQLQRARGCSRVAVHGLFIAVASLVVEHRLFRRLGFSSCCSQALELRLSSCDARAQLLCSVWNLPVPGIKPMSPVLAIRFLSTATREIQFCCLWDINGSSGGSVQPGDSAISPCWFCSPSAVWVFWSTLAAAVSPCPLFAALPPPPRVTASADSLVSPSPGSKSILQYFHCLTLC